MRQCTLCGGAFDESGFYGKQYGRCKSCVCRLARERRALNPPAQRLSDVVVAFGSDTERAWAAGFFDGEGSISVADCNGRRGSLRAKNIFANCNQIHRDVLDRFQEAVGVGTVRGPYPKVGGKPRWDYRANGLERVEIMYEALWPWLDTVKKKQAIAKIAEYRAWREEWEALLPPGNRRIALGPPRKALSY